MTKLTPKNIEWTIADDKIIKKLNDGTFDEVTASDITALGFVTWGGVPEYQFVNATQVWIQNIPHSIWTTPSRIKIVCINGDWWQSIGIYDLWTQDCIVTAGSQNSNTFVWVSIITSVTAGYVNYKRWVLINVNSTSFDINRTDQWSPVVSNAEMLIEIYP